MVQKANPRFSGSAPLLGSGEAVNEKIPLRVPEELLRAYLDGNSEEAQLRCLCWLVGSLEKQNQQEWFDLYQRAARLAQVGGPSGGSYFGAYLSAMAKDYPISTAETEALREIALFPKLDWNRLSRFIASRGRTWLLGWRDITNTTNERTVIAGLLPRAGVGHKFPLIFPANDSAIAASCLVANLSSFALDYTARQKVGGTSMTYFYLKQLPILPPERYTQSSPGIEAFTWGEWIAPYALELAFTAWDMELFARDCGYDGGPFRWNEDRRSLLRCELDAVYFHLYGIPRDDVDYILETFLIVKRKDEADCGEYRTKCVILEIYDAIQQAIETGVPYQTRLDPSPANGWVPPDELLRAAFAAPAADRASPAATGNQQPATNNQQPGKPAEDFELVPPPSQPNPLRDKDGEIYRVRVYTAEGGIALNRGVALEHRKSGEVTTWTVLAEGETVPASSNARPLC